jgi:mono/diheme cytochrome c family protein
MDRSGCRLGRTIALFAIVPALLWAARPSHGQEQAASKPPLFERDVRPILAAHCFRCHGEEKSKGGLRLQSAQQILKGGESGLAVVSGAPGESLLVEKISTGEMPPGKEKKLESKEIDLIRRWILAGAPAEQDAVGARDRLSAAPAIPVSDDGRQFWAFRRLRRPPVPAVRQAERIRTPLDAFILARLEEKSLTFSADADRTTLLRRAFFDLVGLPPSIEEASAFLDDREPGAYARLLDRLLASPHFGERWGRHWLDVVGYVDTVGFDIDPGFILLSDGKWRYRDYVIRSYNQDKPYDRFVTEQLAGDELVDWRSAPQFTAEIQDLLVATGFLRTAEDDTHEPESNIPSVHFAVLHDTLEIVGSSLLGLTLNCARCHDHKFDPIPQEDYYRLMAQFTPAYNPKAWLAATPYKPEVRDRALADVSPAQRAEIEGNNEQVDREVAALAKTAAETRGPYEAKLRESKLAALPEPIRADTKSALETPAEKRSEVQKYLAGKLASLVQVKNEEVAAALTGADQELLSKLDAQITAAKARRRSFGKIQALWDVGPPPPTFLLKRGNFETPGTEVAPGFLSVLTEEADASLIPTFSTGMATSGRRVAFARWLTRGDSRAASLLARSIVNRTWEHLFGQGIVATSDNLGRSGEPPTHAELIEWLSAELISNGWHLKPMIRLMMSSTVYRQASRHDSQSTGDPDPRLIDSSNQLLWRMRLRRLDSEVIRDAVLAVCGQLDRTIGGPPIPQETRPDGMVVVSAKGLPSPAARHRRSVYLVARRKFPLTLLSVFDQPIIATNCLRRFPSAVPLQSLTMLNDPFILEQAGHFAGRVISAAGGCREKQVEIALRMALARPPSSAEQALFEEHLKKQTALFLASNLPADEAERKALASLCHALLNTSEFLYTEGGQP